MLSVCEFMPPEEWDKLDNHLQLTIIKGLICIFYSLVYLFHSPNTTGQEWEDIDNN